MNDMFKYMAAFNGDLSKWDVSSVTGMNGIFNGAETFNGDISKWDVSSVTGMSAMLYHSKAFNGDISKWDVSRVKDMHGMFRGAKVFSGDISEWDVSSVARMSFMFSGAESFNGDISKWDVSSVATMTDMFSHATSFKQKLCGDAWLHSKATKSGMFVGSPGSISRTMCTTTPAAFSPRFKVELEAAVAAYLKVSPKGDCYDCPHGPIGEWDVTRITDMSAMFHNAKAFNGDISK